MTQGLGAAGPLFKVHSVCITCNLPFPINGVLMTKGTVSGMVVALPKSDSAQQIERENEAHHLFSPAAQSKMILRCY